MAEKPIFFGLLLVIGLMTLFPHHSEALFEYCENNNCTETGTFCQTGQDPRCVCETTNYYQSNNNTCVAKVGLGVTCPSSEDSLQRPCLDLNAICNDTGSGHICTCKTGYTNSGGQCIQVQDCPSLNNPENGVVQFDLNADTGTANYTCNQGYVINGTNDQSAVRNCQNSVWSDPEPTCFLLVCSNLTVQDNGVLDITNNTEGGIATYTCNEGFLINGDKTMAEFTRQCSNGAWSNEEPNCSLIECGSPVDTITNGEATVVNETTVNSTATVQCNLGYETEADTVTCLANGNWSSANCTMIDCGSPVNTTTNGIATVVNDTTVNATATVQCNLGYETEADTVTCLVNGSWSSAICSLIDCGSQVDTITNGEATVVNETTVYSTATVQCNVGYETEADTVTCLANGNWSSAICTIIDCDSPVNTITNGVATVGNDTTVNATATVECNLGYETEADTVTCLVNGSWSSAICSLIDCGSAVDTITNGVATVVNETTVNSTATVQCNVGYETEADTVTCLANGNWSSAICTIIDCGPTVNITNGIATVGNETTVNSTATVQCNVAYETVVDTVACLANGSWSSAFCTLRDCGSTINTVTNGNATIDSTTKVNSTATVVCDTGYEINTNTITCQPDGIWSSAICLIKDCGESVTTVSNGNAIVGNTTYESTATVSCNQGYESDTTTITCTADGTWSTAVCTEQICPALANSTLFTVNVQSDTEGGTATYTCIIGYTVGDSTSVTTATRTCTSGAWDSQEPNCTPIDCGTLLNPPNGTVNVNPNNLYEATATYTCNTGYEIASGNSIRRCTASGAWSGSQPVCSKIDCGGLNDPNNGKVDLSSGTLYEATASFTCDPGFNLVGLQTLTCTSGGSWSGNSPTCTRRDCGSLGSLTNGVISYNQDTKYQSIATYSCNPGYIITGTTTTSYSRTCTENGWDGSIQTCSRRDCGSLGSLTNGAISYNQDTKYQSTATYSCITGFIITGTTLTSYSRTCTENGWDGSIQTCSRRDCGSLAQPQNGVVSFSQTNFEAIATYTCNNGYIISGTVADTTATIECTATGSWSGTVTCSVQANPLGTTCINPSTSGAPSAGDQCSGTNAFCLPRSSSSQDYTCQCNTAYYDDNGDQPAGQCREISELRVQNINFASVTTSSMRVSWSPPSNKANLVSGYVVEWRRKDNSVGGGNSQVQTNTFFDISNNVVSGAAYIVKVTSRNTVTYSDTVKTTFTEKEQASKPQQPGSIITASSNLDARDQRINLVWGASSGTVYQYEVRLYESAGQTALATNTTSTSSPSVSIYFSQMKNGHRYDVSIIAVSQLFDGTNFVRSDDRREQIQTDVQIPLAPSSVQCEGTSDNSVTIKWQASTTPNGDLVGYKIDTYRLGSSDVLKTENKTENVGTVEQTFEIGGLSPGSNYYFTVSTINEKYISPTSGLIVNSCQTRASMADAPNDLVISNVQSRNFTVSWTRPTNTSGEHRGYVIQVRRLDDDTCVKQLIIQCIGCTGTFDANTLDNMCDSSRSTTEQLQTQEISSITPIERMFTDLDPDTIYNVIVTAVNTEGRGRIANQTLHTEEEIPQKPKDVTISDIRATSCRITWNIDGPRPGDTAYTVIVDAFEPVIDNSTQLTGFDNRAQDLTGLQEYWNYTVTIRAETSKGQVDSDPKTFTTLAAAPGVVDSFSITLHPSNDYRKLGVSWKIPVLLERKSIIYRFELHHNTSQDMSTGMVPFTRNADDNFTYTQTFNVTPETYYQFKVFAINTDGQNGTVTEEVVMAPPGVPVNDFEDTNQKSVINESLFTSTQTSLNLIYDPTFFINDYAGDLVASGVVLCAVNECPENGIGETMTKEQFETYPNWHQAQPNGYTKYRCTRPTWRQPSQSGRKRRQTGTTEEFVIGNESCNDTTRNEYCNGPLNPGTSYIVHVVICTNGGCLISNKYGPFVTQAVPDDKDDNTAIIVVAVVVPLVVIIAAVVVVMVILRRRAGNKPSRMEPSKIESSLEDPATARIEKHRPIKVSEFEEKLAKLHKDSNLLFSAEYEDLRTIAPSHPQEAANREENRLKNRYINILPFDHSRVKLFSNGEEDSSDYINANYLPGYRSPREYIGCQGPIPGTIDDFWRMVWEQKVAIIVMLTLCKEGQKVKCEQYWPEEQGEPKQYGDVVVEVTSTSTIQTYVMRIFKITYAGQTRTIKHFHFLSWLDFQANVKHDIILDFITHVRSHVQPPDTVGPMIVHCSAGVGRTGTYICLDHLMQFIHDHDFDVNIDIFDMVMRLRDNRPLMVQTEQQYVFIHDCVKELMDRKRKQMENIYENQGFVSAGDENIYQNTEPQLYENVQMKTSF